jgi:DNA invertase Pin-like site-specific DNA recombinase
MTKPPKFVAYYRVSTEKQGQSGLGLEAQIVATQQHAQRNGGEILASFQEVETGKNNDRPQLDAALRLCRQKKAILVIAKLDRLTRNLAFLANLIESKVEFVACDNPHANKTMSQMMAVWAEHESDEISKRTKDALAAAKARGQILGNPRPPLEKMHSQRVARARQFRETAYPLIKQCRDRGMTLKAIADHLNDQDIRSQNKRLWHPEAVRLVLLRHNELAYKSTITAQDAA